MERTISIEDRIKRAEEIYNRKRQDSDVRVNIRTSNINKKEKIKLGLLKKMILQILICIVIYFILYLIKNSNYVFSESVINKTKEFLSYDVNFSNIYNNVMLYYNNNIQPIINKNNTEKENEVQENINEQVNIVDENIELNSADNNEEVLNGIGGGEEEINLEAVEEISIKSVENAEPVQLSQMEIDANDIKENYSLILPLVGTITSRYGPRTPTGIVSANHLGIDIAVNEGTVFVAAMEGKVITASSFGSYGNHIFIQNGDVVTVYAHCKTLYVKEGDIITQGQELGEVGQTGNATGPHLHFEIRKDGRTINPEYILSFG